MRLLRTLRWAFLGFGVGFFFDTLATHFAGTGHELRFAIVSAVCSVLYLLGVLAK